MEPITKDQQQDLTKYDGINNYFIDNQTTVDAYLPLKDEVILFRSNLGLIPDTASGKAVSTKGITTGKSNIKLDTAKAYGLFVPVARGYCIKKGLTMEAANLNWTQNKIYHLDDNKVLEICTLINTVILGFLPNADFLDYGITATTLSNALAKATQFNDSIGLADSVDAAKTAKAINLEQIFDNLHSNNEQFNLLINHFKVSNPDFYNGYIAVNVVHDDVRHTGIDGIVKSGAGSVIKGATIKNLKSGRIIRTDLAGEYEHVPNQPGLTDFECSAAGHQSQTKTIKLKRGKLIHTDWILNTL